MTPQSAAVLERLLRGHGLEWMIDLYAPRERAIPALLEQLVQIEAEYLERIGGAISFSPEALEAEAELNPHKVRAFLQALGKSRSAGMLVMAWRVLQGLSIRELALKYKDREAFDLKVILARPENGDSGTEEYHSQDIHDAVLMRHLGIATVSGQPLFDGFYPLRLKD